MKKLFITLFLSFLWAAGHSQDTTGLVAWWPMSGNAMDSTGHGHNGHISNVTMVPGMNGTPNSAYYFNGSNSLITVPYAPELNVSQFSLCGIVMVKGFYYGTCQANYILTRGKSGQPGSYTMCFFDGPFDNNCNNLDTTKNVFTTNAGPMGPSDITGWQYTPQIVKDVWYKVIFTWNGTTMKIFVNGVLKNSFVPTPGVFGTSMDSLAMGKAIYEPAGYPFNFKGILDDIRIYNRPLNDSEIVHYGDTCGKITVEPTNATTSAGTATFTVGTSIIGATYQWQRLIGTTWTNLVAAAPYTGVTTATLTVTGATGSMADYQYRCVVKNTWGCKDTSAAGTLVVGLRDIDRDNDVMVYPNPVTNELSISALSLQQVLLTNIVGQTVYEWNGHQKELQVNMAELPAGIYLVRINDNVVKKIEKR